MERTSRAEQGGEGLPLAFELLAEIATGPTARVELCRVRSPKEVSGSLVAVKRLHPHIAEDPQFYSMFVDEVWMTAALEHPNVTRVVGWGTDSEGTYLAVELVEGVSLARLMKTVFETREAFTERMVVYLGSEICAGLSAAHALRSRQGEHLNLVHRDLTPGNVLLGFDGRVLIADFGLAKAKQRVTKTLTGLLKGQPQYMAPELATEKPMDARADLFSLGVVLFELFTGRHPWSGTTEVDTLQLMATEPPTDITSLRPKIDRELALIVDGLLAKDPADRFSSADEVRGRLQYWLDAHGYKDDNLDAVARFVRRNAMRQMRWFERAVAGDFVAEATRAKSRLMGARARGESARPGRGQGGTALTSKSSAGEASRGVAPGGAPSARRRAARRVPEEATDVSDMGARMQAPPTNETLGRGGSKGAAPAAPKDGDWGEEVPTVVRPNMQHPAHRDLESLPSFVDDDTSDIRQTCVKPQIGLASLARSGSKGARSAPKYGKLGTELDLPRIDDPDSAEMPTAPVRRPRAVEAAPLQKLPPPQRREPVAGFEAPLTEEPDTSVDEAYATRGSGRAPRTEAELALEADRLAQQAGRLRAEADQAAKLAAQRAVLAQLGAEAAQLAKEATQAFSTHGAAHAMALCEEAYRLESSILRGQAQIPGATASHDVPRSPSVPPPAPTPVMSAMREPSSRDLGGGLAGQSPGVFQGGSAAGYSSPAHAERPSFAPAPAPRPNPFGGDLFAGEVFGVRVPVALAGALLIAVAMVVLVWIIVT